MIRREQQNVVPANLRIGTIHSQPLSLYLVQLNHFGGGFVLWETAEISCFCSTFGHEEEEEEMCS